MGTTRELAISIAFADSTKRSLRFTGVPASIANTLKAKVKAIKDGVDDSGGTTITISDWQGVLRSSGGASATGIAGATYTITQVTPVYDSNTYDG